MIDACACTINREDLHENTDDRRTLQLQAFAVC
jgi:hypothetical protein